MKVLITGGTGFIGAWIAKALIARGISVRSYDISGDLSVPQEILQAEAGKVEWVTGDITDAEGLKRTVAGCDLLIHLAAILTPDCARAPVRGAEICLIGSLNVFEAAKQLGISRVLYMSSAGVFGPEDDGIYPRPTTLYGAYKLAVEGAALQACAIALAAKLEPAAAFDQREYIARLRDFVLHEVYKDKLRRIESLLDETDKTRVVVELGNGIEAFNSVPTAIYSFLSHPTSFEEAILFAVSLGGDTDTIAAMTGAISGAYLGADAIPKKWQDKLENRQYIEELAEQLYSLWIRGQQGGQL